MPKEVKERLKSLPSYRELEVLHKPWYILAVVQKFLGYSGPEISKNLGKNAKSIYEICKSPAAEKLIAYLEEKIEDPVALAKELAKAQVMGVTTDWYMALEWAKEARDYKSVASMTKDLAALGGLQADPPKKDPEGERTIKIVFEGSSLDTKAVEASYEIVEDEDEESEDL